MVWPKMKGYPWWPAVLTPCPVDHNKGEWRVLHWPALWPEVHEYWVIKNNK